MQVLRVVEKVFLGLLAILLIWILSAMVIYSPSMTPGCFANLSGKAYYNLMWWGFVRMDGGYDFAARRRQPLKIMKSGGIRD